MKIPKQFRHESTIENAEEYLYTKNGLRVLYVHIPGCDAVISNIVYLVGARHEARGKTGIAHMLEHMLFKNTKDKHGKKVPVPRYIPLQNKGASLNASTWIDRTNYYFVMPPQYLGEMLQAEAERMRGLILTPKEFAPEQQNVLSEYEMYSENPEFILNAAVTAQAFVSHGYGHETIGYKSDIENLTCEDLQSFYDTYYWPNNAYLVIAGDISRETALNCVDEHFSHIPKSPKPIPQLAIVEPSALGARSIYIERKNPVTLTMRSYVAPRAQDPAWIHAYIALTYLASGKLSPLYKKLVETNKASSITPSLMPSYDPFLFSITCTVSQGVMPEDVQKIMEAEIESLKAHPISLKDCARIKNKLIADMLYGRDGAQAVARELTEYIAGGSWKHYFSVIEDIENTSSADIQSFAKKWLDTTSCITGTFKGI
ncbi:insulinase family protein [Patescibacteria group bacterium]|nr:insulinase family protein [Patescibacteria group bacterium]